MQNNINKCQEINRDERQGCVLSPDQCSLDNLICIRKYVIYSSRTTQRIPFTICKKDIVQISDNGIHLQTDAKYFIGRREKGIKVKRKQKPWSTQRRINV